MGGARVWVEREWVWRLGCGGSGGVTGTVAEGERRLAHRGVELLAVLAQLARVVHLRRHAFADDSAFAWHGVTVLI